MVLDASALLALVNAEPGADIVASALGAAVISAVNLAEVVTRLIDIGVPAQEAGCETRNRRRRVRGVQRCRRPPPSSRRGDRQTVAP
jgi:uncharacterized protein with PIN domain